MRTVEWLNGRVRMIDQRHLPWSQTYVDYEDYREVAQAITDMVVRGAPAIGAAAAFGMALAGQQGSAPDMGSLLEYLEIAAVIMKKSRPTAVNLAWAVDRMMRVAHSGHHRNVKEMKAALVAEAQHIADEDIVINKQMGQLGAALVKEGDVILHHCNTGALATVDYGTALGVVRAAHEQGKKIRALLTETRPRMQGARLSAWELDQVGVPFEVIPDSAAGYYMRKGEINIALVGADRVAANGDTANKIGTYMLAVLAKENNIPFYVVAPTSTIDLSLASGELIPVEERTPDEVRRPYGYALIPDRFPVRNPAFDITPQRYLAGIITEHGVVMPPFRENLPRAVEAALTAK
jgi:methylthioribose-1-phosphate isomerase